MSVPHFLILDLHSADVTVVEDVQRTFAGISSCRWATVLRGAYVLDHLVAGGQRDRGFVVKYNPGINVK